MLPIISFVGYSHTGKTTLIENIVRILSRKGYRVGVLKHTHGAIKADKRGTDTDRFRQAGAMVSAICDDNWLVRLESARGRNPNNIARTLAGEMDLLIIEGYKKEKFPKVLISDDLLVANLKGIIAMVGRDKPVSAPIRHFFPSKVAEIAKWLEIDIIIPARERRRVMIEIDGRELPIKDFVSEMVGRTIIGMLGTLKGGRGRKINVSIDFGDEM